MDLERHRTLSQLMAEVAHEVNTPLGIVNSAASIFTETLTPERIELLAKDAAAKSALLELAEAARLIQKNISRAEHLIRAFKNLSVRQLAEQRECVDAPRLVEEIVALFRIKAKQAMIKVQILDHLGTNRKWTGYPGLLSQVLLNLLSNTARYAYPGNTGGAVDISLTADVVDERPAILIEVRDYGIGIPQEHVSKIFEVFYTTGRSSGGSGLGLAIVDQLVRVALKGKVTVASRVGEGCSFRVWIPRVVEA